VLGELLQVPKLLRLRAFQGGSLQIRDSWLILSLRGVRLGSARLMQLLGVRLGSRTTYAAPRVLLSKSRIGTRTQTEGPSPYWYRLNSTKSQANTTSSCSRKATNTESTCSSATDTSSTGNHDRMS
jgi:hypothetical protein